MQAIFYPLCILPRPLFFSDEMPPNKSANKYDAAAFFYANTLKPPSPLATLQPFICQTPLIARSQIIFSQNHLANKCDLLTSALLSVLSFLPILNFAIATSTNQPTNMAPPYLPPPCGALTAPLRFFFYSDIFHYPINYPTNAPRAFAPAPRGFNYGRPFVALHPSLSVHSTLPIVARGAATAARTAHGATTATRFSTPHLNLCRQARRDTRTISVQGT